MRPVWASEVTSSTPWKAGRGSLARRVARIVAPVFRAKDAGTVRAMYHTGSALLDC